MIVLQIRGVRDSLRFRWSEWGCSGLMVLWGAIVLQPGDVLNTPSWAVLASWAPEWAWGGGAFAVGITRLSVLS